jgi:ABC-2 type transport system permease protein
MWALFQKEIASFFSSLTGYIVIIVFLTINGLFIWVFPGNLNVLDSGFANLNSLFTIAPWVFLFLVPAVTMRSFAEEKKSGTLDLLLTRPLSNLQIILAKFFASVVLIILALIPVLIYYISIILLGDNPGNIDHGAFWGSFIGLLLLAACYSAIGTLASALTENIIVSFIMAIFISFLVYSGLDYLANLFPMGGTGNFIQNLGIDAHYQSISRGVIDSRDLVYFFSLISIFIVFTNIKLASRRW